MNNTISDSPKAKLHGVIDASINVYGEVDADVAMLFKHFNEPPNSMVLEVGANQEYASQILTDRGYKVIGVDLMKFADPTKKLNYHRLRGDFVKLARQGLFSDIDCVFVTSAIEHFGLGTYPGSEENVDWDIYALREIWRLLSPKGTCYITVPYGKNHLVHGRHWRIYNKASVAHRIIQNFEVEAKEFFLSGPARINGMIRNTGEMLTEQEADNYDDERPHVTVFLKLRKNADIMQDYRETVVKLMPRIVSLVESELGVAAQIIITLGFAHYRGVASNLDNATLARVMQSIVDDMKEKK